MSARRDNGEGQAPRLRPDGRWEVRLRHIDPISGKPARQSIYGPTKTSAREKLRDAQSRLRSGSRAVDSQMLVSEWIDHWIATTLRASSNRESTQVNAKYILESTHVKGSRLSEIPLARLRPSSVDGWLADLRQNTDLQESTLLKYFMTLGKCLRGAVRDGLIAINPCDTAEKPKAGASPAVLFLPDELEQFRESSTHDSQHAYWETIRLTGMRGGETQTLTWDDLDLIAGTVRITKTAVKSQGGKTTTGPPKTAASLRTLPIPDALAATLTAHRAAQAARQLAAGENWADGNWVFTTQVGTRLESRNLLRNFRRILARTTIASPVTPHSLRHNMTTELVDSGVPLQAVAAYMGHSSVQTTLKVYAHVTNRSEGAVIAALNLLPGAFVGGAASPTGRGRRRPAGRRDADWAGRTGPLTPPRTANSPPR